MAIRGGTESFIAYADEEIQRNETVIVYRSRGHRSVDVIPFPAVGTSFPTVSDKIGGGRRTTLPRKEQRDAGIPHPQSG